MSIIVCLVILCCLGAVVRVAFGVFKVILAVVFISVMVHSCNRSDAQVVADPPSCCRSAVR
jgi:hypothetical protein